MDRMISTNGKNLIWREEDIPDKVVKLTVEEGVDAYLYHNGSYNHTIIGDGMVSQINTLFKKTNYQVYCINTKLTLDVFFGTNSPAKFIDKDLKFELQAKARGHVVIALADARVLIDKLRMDDDITNDGLIKEIQPIIINVCTSKLKTICQNKSKNEVLTIQRELSKGIIEETRNTLASTEGFFIKDVIVDGITVTGDEDYQKNQTTIVLTGQNVAIEKK